MGEDMSTIPLRRLGLLAVAMLGLLSLFSASALAAGSPIVTGTPASNRVLNGATLNGTVNPNGASTTYKFEWGATTAYGNSTAKVSAGSGSSASPVSALLRTIEPGKTYHYRVSATNSFGTTVSADTEFETLQWRVEGKPVSEYPIMRYSSVKADWTMIGEGTTKGGTAVKVTCANTTFGEYPVGDFVAGSYPFLFTGCKVVLNGVESKKCSTSAASYTELRLNASLVATTGKVIPLGETCAIGEEIVFGNGFEVSLGSSSELARQAVTVTGVATNLPLTFTIHTTWGLVGIEEGRIFGLS
jgi:hypothetical protein